MIWVMSKSVSASNRDYFQAIYPNASQRLTVAATSVQSNAVDRQTSIVELFATTDCWVVFGSAPVAAANDGASFFLPAGLFKYYGIEPGYKIAAIRSSSDGLLYVIEGGGF